MNWLNLMALFVSWLATPGQPEVMNPPQVTFTDVAQQAGLNFLNVSGGLKTKRYLLETTGNGLAWIDYDRDGYPDLFLVTGTTLEGFPAGQEPTNRLFHNNGDGTFTDVTEKAGLAHSGWGQGACVGDYDNDGWDDLFVTYYGKNLLYHNNGDGTFTEVAEMAGVAGDDKRWNTGCAFLDYDRRTSRFIRGNLRRSRAGFPPTSAARARPILPIQGHTHRLRAARAEVG